MLTSGLQQPSAHWHVIITAVKKHKNMFYLLKSLFQSFHVWNHLAEAQTAACTLTRWCYQLITNPLPPRYIGTALQINCKKKLDNGDLLCFGPVSCCRWCNNQIMEMSLSLVLLWTEADWVMVWCCSFTCLINKRSQKSVFMSPLLEFACSLNFLHVKSTSCKFLDVAAHTRHKMRNPVRKEQQPSLTRLFNGTKLLLVSLLPAAPVFWNFERGPLLLQGCS